jgi:hypothetical protein
MDSDGRETTGNLIEMTSLTDLTRFQLVESKIIGHGDITDLEPLVVRDELSADAR